MKMKRIFSFVLSAAMVFSAFGALAAENSGVSKPHFSGYVSAEDGDIELVSPTKTPSVYIDENDYAGVIRAADDLKKDILSVTGTLPADAQTPEEADIIIGTIGHSNEIDKMASDGRLDISKTQGEWEAFTVQDVGGKLVIAGADKRGTIYGIYDLSENMGISPWVWWADVTPAHSDTVYISLPRGGYSEGASSVKYRGIFINQEWNLYNWSKTHSDSGEGMDTDTYEKIFELLLRLKANYMWPAMHEFSPAFNSNPENARLADEYGIVMGSSHCEMLLRNNMGELLEFQERWISENPDKPLYMFRDGSLGADVAYDYTDVDKEGNRVFNKEFIEDYWRERVRANKDYESNFTIGMRGVHDGAWDPVNADTDEEKIELLEEIIAVQRRILEEEIGKPANEIPQTFIPYKEILPLYNKGLEIPDDVTIMWTNDNYGHLRQTPNEAERQRQGGSGIYYHVSYYGRPSSIIWNGGTQLGLIKEEMTKAYDTGAKTVWILNVGPLKLFENQTEYFLDLGRDIESVRSRSVNDYVAENAKNYFGFDELQAKEYADIQCEFLETANSRRPDFMKQNLFSLTGFGDEGQKLLDKYAELENRSTALYNLLSEDEKYGFYELQLYAIRSASSVAGTFINADKSVLYNEQGRGSSVNKYAELSKEAWARVSEDVNKYNSMLDGKWKNAVDPFQKVESGSWDIMRSWKADAVPAESGSVDALPYTDMGIAAEGQTDINTEQCLKFSGYSKDFRFIDIFNRGTGSFDWRVSSSADWIIFNKESGTVHDDDRIYAGIDWDKAPAGMSTANIIVTRYIGETPVETESIAVTLNNDIKDLPEKTYAEANGYVSIEAEHYTNSVSKAAASASEGVIWGEEPKLVTDTQGGIGIIAVYSPDGKLGSVQFSKSYENGAYVFGKAAYPVPGGTVKGMVWETLENMKPLCRPCGAADTAVYEWAEQDDFGRSGTSVKFMPDTAKPAESGAYLEYDVNFESTGTFPVDVYRMPTLNERGSVSFGIGIDSDTPNTLEGRNTYYNNSNGTDRWGMGILNNAEVLTTEITVDEPGIHTIRLYGIDPGVVIDKIVIATDEKKASYYGAPESFNTTFNNNVPQIPQAGTASSSQTGQIQPLFEPVFYISAIAAESNKLTSADIIKLSEAGKAQITAAAYNSDGIMTSCNTISYDFSESELLSKITVPIELDITEDTSEIQLIIYNGETLEALSPVYTENINTLSPAALYDGGKISPSADISRYDGKEAICRITEENSGETLYIRQETVDKNTFRMINTGELDGTYDVMIGIASEGIAVNEKVYTAKNIEYDNEETAKTIYSWNFEDKSQAAQSGTDIPVISGSAAYDEENRAIKLTSADNKGSGKLNVEFSEPIAAVQGGKTIISFKAAYGRQSGKYTDWSVADSNGNIIASTHICLYSSGGEQSLQIGGEEFLENGLPAGIATENKNNSGLDNGYTSYTVVLDPDQNTVTVTAKNDEGESTFTGSLRDGTNCDIKTLSFAANTQYQSRSSYIDDISVTSALAQSYNIVFDVTDISGTPVRNAEIILTDAKYGTTILPENSGVYRLCDGRYNYTVKAAGIDDKTGTLELSPASESKTVNIIMDGETEPLPPAEEYDSTAGYWKFVFGGNAVDDAYGVSADTSYTDTLDYGFIGNKAEDYKLSAGEHIDGFRMLEGQCIELENGSINGTDFVTAKDPQEPIRFAMSAENGGRYKVRVKLANASATESASVTLMTERRHQLLTGREIPAGETLDYEFSVDVETYYWKALNGKYEDDTISIQVVGENAAIASLEVIKEDGKTLWVVTDSTGCDQPANFPYVNINSLAGVGQGITKYLPEDIAISNHGDGGLNSSDTNHYNCAKSGFKAGDILYVEYGHNETSVESYAKNLQKYYDDCRSAGVKMIVAGPIDRCQPKQFNAETGEWSPSGLTNYAAAGRAFVEEKQNEGADDIAFVDINAPWIEFLNQTAERVKNIRKSDIYEADSAYYYYRYKPSGIDTTHINEAGADNAAYIFFTEAKRIVEENAPGAAVLSELVNGMRDETPYIVPDEVIAAGPVPNEYYPDLPAESYDGYEAVIRGAEFDGDELKNVTVKVEHYTGIDAKNIPYAVAATEITDENGGTKVYYSSSGTKYDATNGNGIFELKFDGGAAVPQGASYRIYLQGFTSDNEVMTGDEYRLSEYFTSETASNMSMIGGADDISKPENFDYYGVRNGAALGGNNGWYLVGSSEKEATLEHDGDVSYAHLSKSSKNGSYVVYRAFDSAVNSGKLILDADIYYESGTAKFVLSNKTSSPNSGYDMRHDCFAIENGAVTDSSGNLIGNIPNDSWQHINYILDMDYGAQTLTIGDSVYEYTAEGLDAVIPENVTIANLRQINVSGASNDELHLRLTNVSVRSEANAVLPDKTVTLIKPAEGIVSAADGNELSASGKMNSTVAITAVPYDGYVFVGWFDENGELVSGSPSAKIRLHRDITLTARFEPDNDTTKYLYRETFSSLSTSMLAENGWISPNAQSGLTVENNEEWPDGNYLNFNPPRGSRNMKKEFGIQAFGTPYMIDMDFGISNGSGGSGESEFTLLSSGSTAGDNKAVEGEYLLKLNALEKSSGSKETEIMWQINGADTVMFAQNGNNPVWAHLAMTVDTVSGKADVIITQNGAEIYHSALQLSVTDGNYTPAGVNFFAGRQYSKCKIDNIRIYPAADQ